jgi:pimeloyl-ACP methyl ester carboxylesterase
MNISRNLAFLLTIIVVFSGDLGCADKLILPPRPRQIRMECASADVVSHDGWSIEVFTARSRADVEPRAFVLRFTGGDAAGAVKFTASRWAPHAVEAWVVNYPGYGGSDGPRTLAAMAAQSLDAYDELRRIAGERPIFVEGFSLGTVPALCVAARRPVAGVILQNPPPLRELIVGAQGWWNLWLLAWPVSLQVPRELDSIANARASTAPAIFLLAERDRTIPLVYQRKVADAYAGTRRVILQRGADHVTPPGADEEREFKEGMAWMMWLVEGAAQR